MAKKQYGGNAPPPVVGDTPPVRLPAADAPKAPAPSGASVRRSGKVDEDGRPIPTKRTPRSPEAKERRAAKERTVRQALKEMTALVREGKKKDRAKRAAAAKATRSRGRPREKEGGGAPAWEPTEQEKGQIMALAGFGMTLEETSVVLGVNLQTLLTHRAAIEELRAKGLSVAKSRVRQSVYEQAVGGSLGHARFFEERVLGWIPNQRTEITGADGGPVESVGVTRVLSDDDVIARLRTLVDRTASVTAVAPVPGATAGAGTDTPAL